MAVRDHLKNHLLQKAKVTFLVITGFTMFLCRVGSTDPIGALSAERDLSVTQ